MFRENASSSLVILGVSLNKSVLWLFAIFEMLKLMKVVSLVDTGWRVAFLLQMK